jgi:hypothetical protein
MAEVWAEHRGADTGGFPREGSREERTGGTKKATRTPRPSFWFLNYNCARRKLDNYRNCVCYNVDMKGRKHCAVCKVWKEKWAFGKDGHRPDGLYCACKECRKMRTQQTYDRKLIKAGKTRYVPPTLDELALRKARNSAKAKEKWRIDYANPEFRNKILLQMRLRSRRPAVYYRIKKWRDENRHILNQHENARRDARINGFCHLTADEKKRTLAIYAWCAKLNGIHSWSSKRPPFHVDHILGLCEGGRHHPDNLRVTTATFNLAKPKYSDKIALR